LFSWRSAGFASRRNRSGVARPEIIRNAIDANDKPLYIEVNE